MRGRGEHGGTHALKSPAQGCSGGGELEKGTRKWKKTGWARREGRREGGRKYVEADGAFRIFVLFKKDPEGLLQRRGLPPAREGRRGRERENGERASKWKWEREGSE